MNNTATYVVIDVDSIIQDMIEESIGNENSFRKSLDGTKAILKFNTKYPNTMKGYRKYNHKEILQFLTNNVSDWEILKI